MTETLSEMAAEKMKLETEWCGWKNMKRMREWERAGGGRGGKKMKVIKKCKHSIKCLTGINAFFFAAQTICTFIRLVLIYN